jgi:hypothetical protein
MGSAQIVRTLLINCYEKLRAATPVLDESLFFQQGNERTHPGRVIRPRPRKDHVPVNDGGGVHKLSTSCLNVGLQGGVSGCSAALQYTRREKR